MASAVADQRHALEIQGPDRQPCLKPGCLFMEPSSLWKPGHCCNKSAVRHAGEEWAEGGVKRESGKQDSGSPSEECPPPSPETLAFPVEDGYEEVDYSAVEAPEPAAPKDLGEPVSDSTAAAASADAERAVARARSAWRQASFARGENQARGTQECGLPGFGGTYH